MKRENARPISAFIAENSASVNPFTLLPLEGKRPLLTSWASLPSIPSRAWNDKRIDSVGVRTGLTARGFLLCIDIDTTDAGTFDRVQEAIIDAGTAHGHEYPAGSLYVEKSAHGWHVFILTTADAVGDPRYKKQKLVSDPTHAKGSSGWSVELISAGGQVRIYPSSDREPLEGGTLLNLSEVTPRAVVDSILSSLKGSESFTKREEPKSLGGSPAPTPLPVPSTSDDPARYLRENPRAVVDYLTRRGWALLKEDPGFWYLQRPGTADRSANNHSITVCKDGGAVCVWSSNLPTPSDARISPLAFLSDTFHGGNVQETCRELIRGGVCPAPSLQSSCGYHGARLSEFDAYEETTAPPVDFTTIEERARAIASTEETGGLFTSIEGAITYGSRHMAELEEKLPDELYHSSDTLRKMIDSISPVDNGARVGYFAAAWAVASFLLGGSVYEEHYCNGARQTCSTAQYSFLFAPSGAGKNTCKSYIQESCRRYNRPAQFRAIDQQKHAEEEYRAELKSWESQPREKRGARPSRPAPVSVPRACINQPASRQSLENDWSKTAGKIMICVDEARDYLKSMTAPDARDYRAGILTALREAYTTERGYYSVETSQTARGQGVAPCVEILNPSLHAFYCGVPLSSWDTLAHCAEDGTLGRFNFFFFNLRADREITVTAHGSETDRRYSRWVDDLIDRWAGIADRVGQAENPRDRGQCIAWAPEALEYLARYIREANLCAENWRDRCPAFASCVGHSPLRYCKAALIYAVLNTTEDDLRYVKITVDACRRAYRFMLYQFAQLMHVYNLRGAVDYSPIMKKIRGYAQEVIDKNGWFTVPRLKERGFTVDGWKPRSYTQNLIDMSEAGELLEWNGIRQGRAAFRIIPTKTESTDPQK